MLTDPFGRNITYLRVSVTDRCDLRCTYCMAEDMTFLPKRDLLTLEELDRLCSAFVRLGVRKIRVTGGEPLVRKNVIALFQALGRHIDSGALDELTLTTNGTRLAQCAADLYTAGVRRINVSLDTLDPDTFRTLTRRGDLPKVLEGLAAAKAAGLAVKINTVALRQGNRHEIRDLVAWAHGEGFDITFIETMPMGEIAYDRDAEFLPLTWVRDHLREVYTLEDIAFSTGGPSRYVRVAETGRKIGFISPLTHNFCTGCNRVRVTCTGTIHQCLGQEESLDLRAPLRASPRDDLLMDAIHRAIGRKPLGHDFVIAPEAGPAVGRHMSVTGG